MFWVLWTCLTMHTQRDTIILQKALVFICRKKSTSFNMLFRWYCKDMQTSYFGYLPPALLHTSKMIESICRKLPCLSASQKQTSSFTSLLRYYILKNPAIWLAGNTLANNSRARILPDWWWNINNNTRLFPRKTNDKFFRKI